MKKESPKREVSVILENFVTKGNTYLYHKVNWIKVSS